ncbi:MAG TPA: serine/threonine-protein kinase [Ktedonobacteraceae bacterium]
MREGQILLGKYRIRGFYRQGGMADIYEATDESLNRRVAIKLLRIEDFSSSSDLPTRQKLQRQFQSEIRIIAAFDHQHILVLHDHKEDFSVEPPLIYMIMPFQQQGSLAEWLKKRKQTGQPPLSFTEACRLVTQAAEALQYVHEHDIVHQDVKPQNFLLRDSTHQLNLPDILLSDFGIAKSMSSQPHTKPLGTARYMAPEQWNGHPVFASDQYALACVAYELLTGAPPFQGNPTDLLMQHLNSIPVPPGQHKRELPAACDGVILKALEKNPGARFPSIREFASTLARCQDAGAATIGMTPPIPANVVLSPDPVRPPLLPSLGLVLLSTLLVACLILGGLGGFLLGKHSVPPPAPENIQAIVATSIAGTQSANSTAQPATLYKSVTNSMPMVVDNLHSFKLQENHGAWKQSKDSCFFQNQYYHTVNLATPSSTGVPGTTFQLCSTTLPVLGLLTRFAFQVDMQVLQGTSGGITFYVSDNFSSFYYFRLLNGGKFEFGASDNGTTLIKSSANSSPFLPANLVRQKITLTVIASVILPSTSLTFNFYADTQNTHFFSQITQEQLSVTLASGSPGVLAVDGSSVQFQNARVWDL